MASAPFSYPLASRSAWRHEDCSYAPSSASWSRGGWHGVAPLTGVSSRCRCHQETRSKGGHVGEALRRPAAEDADAAIRLSRQSLESIKRPPDDVSRSDLTSWGWDPDELTKRDPTTGWTACHDAALRGRLDLIAYITDHGGEETLNYQDLFGNTPIGETQRA